MSHSTFVLFAGADNWRLAVRSSTGPQFFDLSIPANASPQQIAAAVSEALSKAAYAGEGILLAIPSAWCFSASIAIGDLPRHDCKAMLYRLEEKLPLAAEGVVADFILHREEALGVCAKLSTLAPLVEALESKQIPVQSIAPTVLLAAQMLEAAGQSSRVLLCGQPAGQVDLVAVDGTPLSWASVPGGARAIKLQLELICMSLSAPPRIEAVELDAPVVSHLEKALSEPIHLHDGLTESIALDSASEILAGRRRPWIELRRGVLAIRDSLRLHRRPLNAVLAATVVLLLCLSASLLYRAHRYNVLVDSADRQMVDAFREQFPGWEVPSNVRVIVESEHRKAALAASGAAPTRSTRTALQTFADVLGRLPTEGRFSIDKMSFGESSFEMEGQVRSNDQLDGIASAARQAGMDVEPPEARKTPEGFWSFILRGASPSADKSPGEVAKGAN
jgi:hypothetical protein